jgi:hypothetical protein
MPRRRPDPGLVRALEQVEQAVSKLRAIDETRESAREELRVTLVEARQQGASLAVLARIVGVSRQRISAIVPGRRCARATSTSAAAAGARGCWTVNAYSHHDWAFWSWYRLRTSVSWCGNGAYVTSINGLHAWPATGGFCGVNAGPWVWVVYRPLPRLGASRRRRVVGLAMDRRLIGSVVQALVLFALAGMLLVLLFTAAS